jgi:hypothetical protein
MVFLTLLIIPALVALGFLAFGGKRVSLKEFLVHMAAMLVYTGACCGIIYWRNTHDVEHINGVVTAKRMERVSCRHPYCCRWCESCTTDSKGHQSCHEYCCQTCYDHPYDQDWNVYSNVNRSWSIDTLDRQGLREPPRWTSTQVGEPVTWVHSYENYVKAAPGTLFKRDNREDEKRFKLPEERVEAHDYWHTDQLVQVGIDLADAFMWNRDIERVNGYVGPLKQANLVVVVVRDQPRDYFEALRAKWMGGKKNDVVLVIGVDAEQQIVWADVMAWSYNELIRVEMRDSLVALGRLDREKVIALAQDNIVRNFDRKHMKDFKYLTASFAPTGTQYVVCLLIGVLLSIGLGVLFYTQDIFGDER